jgi:hypothetical protein
LLQIYDRSISQNSCARTDIILKRGSRPRRKQTESQQQELPSLATTMMNIKQEDRNLSVCLQQTKKSFLNFYFSEIIIFVG